MKKIFFLAAFIISLALIVTPVMAAKPTSDKCATIQGESILDSAGQQVKLGYDKWGYNYQANMFNGIYDNYSRPTEAVTSGDRLMMKWNNAWLSNKDCDGDYKLDRHFGFPTYKGSGAWLTNHASGTYMKGWDVSGTWNFDVVSTKWPGTYSKTMVITQISSGIITGTGSNVPPGQTWSVTGTVTGNNVNLSLAYDVPMVGYVATLVGTIQPDGSINGTWSDVMYGDSGSWHSTSGIATNQSCEWNDFVKIVAVPMTAILDAERWYTDSAKTTEIGLQIWGEFAIIQEVSSNPCGNDLGLMNYKSQLRSGLGNW